MKNFYSQFGEDKFIFENLNIDKIKGNVLDLGANDGKTISNSLCFIENGWGATLIEASPIAFEKLKTLHQDNEKIQCLNLCLANEDKKYTFYHNVTHFGRNDTDLLSTISEQQFRQTQGGYKFSTFEVDGFKFSSIEDKLKYNNYEVISIDIEGLDYDVLTEIDLTKYQCQILIIEYNKNIDLKNKIINYCKLHKLENLKFDNGVNLILTK